MNGLGKDSASVECPGIVLTELVMQHFTFTETRLYLNQLKREPGADLREVQLGMKPPVDESGDVEATGVPLRGERHSAPSSGFPVPGGLVGASPLRPLPAPLPHSLSHSLWRSGQSHACAVKTCDSHMMNTHTQSVR